MLPVVTGFEYEDFVKLVKQFGAAYRLARDPKLGVNQSPTVRQFNQHHADALRKLLTENGATIRTSQEIHHFPVDDTGEQWQPTLIETIYVDWEHYTYVVSVSLPTSENNNG